MDDAAWFTEMHEAFQTLGFDRIQDIYSLIAGILHLGNINFTEGDNDNAQLAEGANEEVKLAAKCFGIKPAGLITRLLTATLVSAGIAP